MNIMIIDDNQLLTDGLQQILNNFRGGSRIFKHRLLSTALEQLHAQIMPDLILIGTQMWRADPRNFTLILNEFYIPVVLLNANDDTLYIESLPSGNFSGYIDKSYTASELIQALETIVDGHKHIPIYLVDSLKKKIAERSTKSYPQILRKKMGVTKRQYEVLKLMAQGYSNKMIADTLCLTEHTIKSHVSALFQVMNTKNRMECVIEASHKGLITRPAK